MTPTELGIVFNLLLKYREIHGNPPDRPTRDNEPEVARILANCTQADLQALEEFLAVQGFTLYIRDAQEFGIPAKPGVHNRIYVMTRLSGEPLANYVDQAWAFEQFRDGRRKNTSKAERVVWLARMWLTLQWFFYEFIDRLPSEVSRYREALISEKLFIETLSRGIEQLGNAGRPEGTEGEAWSHLWDNKGSLNVYALRFLKIMEDAGMIHDAGNPGEYRQTLVAAVDIAVIAEKELNYLLPTDQTTDVARRTVEMIEGQTTEETVDADPSTN